MALLESLECIEPEFDFVFVMPSYGPIIDRLKSVQPLGEVIIKDFRWWMSGKLPSFRFYKLRSLIRNAIAVWDLRKILKECLISDVFSNTLVVPIGPILARILGVRHYWYIHEYGKEDHNLQFMYGTKLSYFFIKKWGGTVFTNSRTLSNYHSSYLKVDIPVVYYTVKTPQIEKAEGFFYDSHVLRLILYGRIVPSKGQKLALEALLLLKRSGYNNVRLTIMGSIDDMKYFNEIAEYAKSVEIDSLVRFIPHENQPFHEVCKHDVVLNCSKREAFGRINIESMKLGLLILATESGSSTELIRHNMTGYIYKANAASLAESVEKIINSPKESLLKIVTNGRKYAHSEFSVINHKISLLSILSNV
ncbi:MAG TPA: glycosyltransferase [Flavipsychrobacter sp.]|nr:glycosyltransferase [Flavipsychrobacter sp.]